MADKFKMESFRIANPGMEFPFLVGDEEDLYLVRGFDSLTDRFDAPTYGAKRWSQNGLFVDAEVEIVAPESLSSEVLSTIPVEIRERLHRPPKSEPQPAPFTQAMVQHLATRQSSRKCLGVEMQVGRIEASGLVNAKGENVKVTIDASTNWIEFEAHRDPLEREYGFRWAVNWPEFIAAIEKYGRKLTL